jgi:hypothetical protein
MATSNHKGASNDSAKKLVDLGRAAFPDLTSPEEKMLRAAANGQLANIGPSAVPEDPSNDAGNEDQEWGEERAIRAAVLRWLAITPVATTLMDPRGIALLGAQILGDLDLAFATVVVPTFFAHCRVENLTLTSATLRNLNLPGSWIRSLSADALHLQGNLFIRNGFVATEEVRMRDAQIEGDIDCDGGEFRNPNGLALDLIAVNVRGQISMREGFKASGEVNLTGAKIGGDLNCKGGVFNVLAAERVSAGGRFWWNNINASGDLELNLAGASFDSLVDDRKSWPKPGKLHLYGLSYKRIEGGSVDAASRLDWLSREEEFSPQPYRQLATVLTEAGDSAGARQVLFEMERRQRLKNDHTVVEKGWSAVLRTSVGYGRYPGRAATSIAALAGIGWIIYRRAYLSNAVAPTDKDAYQEFKGQGKLPPHYRPFRALVYSLENSLPLVNLGQADNWAPDPNPSSQVSKATRSVWTYVARWFTSPQFLQTVVWVQILLGWLLATLFVAGVTGIVH